MIEEQKIHNNDLLVKLEEFIRKYYKNQLIKGAIFFTGAAISFFLLISLLEYFGHFNTTFRTILFYSFVLFNTAVLVKFIIIPLLKLYKIGSRLNFEKASLIIGSHFGNIKDKLLNTLQLQKQFQNQLDNLFLAASIEQKTKELKPVKFTKAINLNKNFKYLKYAAGPFLILILIMIIAPGFKETTTRLIQYDKHFAVPAPFEFVLVNKNLNTLQNEDLEIELKIKGKTVPEEVYLVSDGSKFRMKKENIDGFKYKLINLQKTFNFHFESSNYTSDEFKVSVKQKPVLLDFFITLQYPPYIKRTNEKLENIGDLSVPEGTKVTWFFNTKNVESINLKSQNINYKAVKDGNNRFTFSKTFKTSEVIKLSTSNKNSESKDSVIFQINAIADAYPQIDFKESTDSLNSKIKYFAGNIKDDYGFTKLVFRYKFVFSNDENRKINELHSRTIVIIPSQNVQNFFFDWEMTELNIKHGEKIEYYFEIWDNDGVNGPKATRTSNGIFAAPTIEEIEKETEQSNKEIKQKIEETIKDSKDIEKELKKIEEKLTEKNNLNWEDKKQIEDLLKKHNELQERMKEIIEKNKDKDKKESEYKNIDSEIKNKQDEIQKLMNELMDDEMKKLMEEIKDLLEKNKKDELKEKMDKLKSNEKDLKKKMERALELLKQLELEKKMKETIEKLDQLSKEQEKLSEDTKNNKESTEELLKKQEELNKKFDDIKKELKDIKEKNQKLEKPNKMNDTKKSEDTIDKEQKESKDELEKKQNKKAAPHQKKAADEMEEMSEKMQKDMLEMQMQRQEEDYNTLRQILENLIQVSKDQEKLLKEFKIVGGYNPKYVELSQEQKKLKDDTKIIEDSLFALSKRVIQIKSFINKEIALVNENMEKTFEHIGQRNIPGIVNKQQYIMTSLNNLALMLSDVLKNMQEQMKNAQPNPNCKNPKKGKGKKPSMSEIREMQEKMNKEMGEMKKEGKRPSSKQLAEIAAKQAALRKKLQDLQKELEKEGDGNKLGDLEKTRELMDEVEKDIVNKKVTDETLKRQQEILTRLLEHERAEKQQEQEEKRTSNEGKEIKRELPPSLQEYLKQQKKGQDLLQTISPELSPYLKQKVKEYLNSLDK
ncbi:MAG: hypothetical protein HUU47_01860 [Bacteroidetes bacterium]|nr:hypothetical protein [Bacteroidota bacterium]